MNVCIVGDGLVSLTLAKALVNQGIYVDIFSNQKINKIDKTRTIAIGDSLFHDIKGANNFTIDSILVKSGIHNDTNTINKLCQNHEIKPKFIIDNFSI